MKIMLWSLTKLVKTNMVGCLKKSAFPRQGLLAFLLTSHKVDDEVRYDKKSLHRIVFLRVRFWSNTQQRIKPNHAN